MDALQKLTEQAVRVANSILTPLGYTYTLST